MPQILVFSFSLVTLEFSIHNFFKTRMLLEILDAEFPYKLSDFESLCQLNKMAAKTVKGSVWGIYKERKAFCYFPFFFLNKKIKCNYAWDMFLFILVRLDSNRF